MTGNRKRIIYMLMGITAGVMGYGILEMMMNLGVRSYLLLALLQGAFLGAVFGAVFGFSDGFFYRDLHRGLIKAGIAAALGAVTVMGAMVLSSQGMLWTAGLFNVDYGRSMDILLSLWRSLGWMVMGMAIGAVDGIQKRSSRRIVAGLLGGLVGGLLGGLLFEFLMIYLSVGSIARGVGLIALGLLVGLFLGEFEKRFSYARLRVLNGSLKEREYLLVKYNLRLGANLGDDIYLTGYGKAVQMEIHRAGGESRLHFTQEVKVLLNDVPPMDGQVLKYNDVIQLGSAKLLYLPL